MSSLAKWHSLFGRLHSVVIGMIHLKALPGTPLNKHTPCQLANLALKEAEIYIKAGVDAILLENTFDVPYVTSVGPEITSVMTRLCCDVRRVVPKQTPCGIQVLAGHNREALAISAAAELQFVRVEGYVFAHVGDEGMSHACAGDLLRYRKQIGAENILVFTDIKKKHSSHAITSDVDVLQTAEAAQFFLSDGVIITGKATGAQANQKELNDLQCNISLPVLIGSGVTNENVESFISANGLIVGSHFKENGSWDQELDEKKVTRFMQKIKLLRS